MGNVMQYLRFGTKTKVYQLQVVVFINQQVFLKLRYIKKMQQIFNSDIIRE